MVELEKKELSILADNKANSLLDAISIVAEGVAKKYQYDQTIEAKIISVARKDQGIYKCEYENAIFDAYSNDTQSFYENETVYVNVPRGDFTKQKHIIGRKVDLEAAPDKVFNFKMPFDDFVGLESLTAQIPYARDSRNGFWANYAMHGNKQEVSDQYLALLQPYLDSDDPEHLGVKQIDKIYNDRISDIENIYKDLKTYLSSEWLTNNNATVYTPGSRLALREYDSNSHITYLEQLESYYRHGMVSDARTTLLDFIHEIMLNDQSVSVMLGQEDINILQQAADYFYKEAKNEAENTWNINRAALIESMNTAMADYTDANYTHLWSWYNSDGEHKPLVETKLGISLDIETRLGSYLPVKGEFGLRIVLTGITQPTEEEPSETKTTEVYWTNDQMYGNTYAFYTPYKQQRIIDISNFLTLDRIDVFFHQNTNSYYDAGTFYINQTEKRKLVAPNFISQSGETIPFTYIDTNGHEATLPYNIFFTNLEVFLGLTTAECNTDRVLLYTYDDVTYGQDPYSLENRSQKDTRELKFSWIHRTDSGNVVLVDHVQKKAVNDTRALETYGAQIYWYQYEYNAPQDTDELVYKYAGVNWKFLDHEKSTLHREWRDEEDILHSEDYTSYCNFNITVTPDITKAREKWKTIVVCNGVPYATTPLVFTNADAGVETDAEDKINEVAFRLLREVKDESGNVVLKVDNNLSNFMVYDENGICIQNDENQTWSDLNYYIQVWIRNNDDGTYLPLALALNSVVNGNVQQILDANTFEIDWQLPTGNSMLCQVGNVTDVDLTHAELAPTLETNVSGYNEVIRKSTKKFKIQRKLDMRATDNTIAAVIKRNGKIYKIQQEFFFGQSGSMGSPYTIALVQDKPENGSMIEDAEFQVRAVVYDSTGREAPNKNYVFSWELLAPTIITNGQLNNITGLDWQSAFSNVTFTDDNKGNVKNILHGYIRNVYPPVFRVTVSGAADYPISATKAFSLVDNEAINSNYEINCPSKVEFRSDGVMPITVNSTFEVNCITSLTTKQQIHPTWEVEQRILQGNSWNLLAENERVCIGLKKVSVPQTNLTTSLNPDIWVYKNNGTYDFDQPFLTSAPTTNANLYEKNNYDSVKAAINQAYETQLDSDVDADIDTQKAYMDLYNERINRLNAAINAIVPSYIEYSLNPYIGYSSTSNVPWQWRKDLGDKYYTIIYYNYGGSYFKQAIAFTRNVYSSSLVNNWDDTTLELDHANSAVLAKMISAGAKDTNNRFTGVMMGDWASKADSSLDVAGLYGVKYGEQVFGFKVDGTGFIGKSGKGRIEFDGNRSLISNSDKTCYLNLDPIKYTVTNNQISGLNDYTGFSQYFLFAKTPKNTIKSTPKTELEKLSESTYWTQTFLQDSENDYFIVDPNNGVLTTGGIIASYGKIGEWLISRNGLYQRKINADYPNRNRYMYLGYADLSEQEMASIEDAYAGQEEALEIKYEIDVNNARSKFANEYLPELGKYYKNIFRFDPMHYYNFGWPYESFIQALTDTIERTSETTSWNTHAILLRQYLKQYIEAETRTGYHLHYLNGEPDEYGPQYTGDRQIFNYLVYDMRVTEPNYSTINELNEWAVTNHYTAGKHRTVTFTDHSNDPVDEEPIEGGEEQEEDHSVVGMIKHITIDTNSNILSVTTDPEKNIDSLYHQTEYWTYDMRSLDNVTLYALYDTDDYPLVIQANQSGYATLQEMVEVQNTLPFETTYYGCVKIVNSKLRYFLYTNGIFFMPVETAENSSTYTPTLYVLPRQTRTKYSDDNPRRGWSYIHETEYGIEDETIESIDLNFGPSVARDNLIAVRDFAKGIYQYYTDAYNMQLDEMLAAGTAELEGQALEEYQAILAEQEQAFRNYVTTVIDPIYAEKRARIAARKAQDYNNLISSTDNRYAIFAGYNPDSDPLFSVNWRGYFTARSGKIGNTSPWYIADRGLTQENNSGTIFLGDPETDGHEDFNVFIGNNSSVIDSTANGANISLLPNGVDSSNGKLGPVYYTINTTTNQIEASYGNFAIYAGKGTIKFGVRMDGSLLSTRGNIGGWLIDAQRLQSLPGTKIVNGVTTLDYTNQIILDSINQQLIFGNGSTILYGNGMLKLSTYASQVSDTDSGTTSTGTYAGVINLGGYFLQGITSAVTSEDFLLGMEYQEISKELNLSAHDACSFPEVNYYFKGKKVDAATKPFTEYTATADTVTKEWNKPTDPNVFKLFDSTRQLVHGGVTTNVGINILTGILKDSQVTTTQPEGSSGGLTQEQQDRITALETKKTVINGAITDLRSLLNYIVTNSTVSNNIQDETVKQKEALANIIEWFRYVQLTANGNAIATNPNNAYQYNTGSTAYTSLLWANVYFNVLTAKSGTTSPVAALQTQINNFAYLNYRNNTDADYAPLKQAMTNLYNYNQNIVGKDYGTDCNIYTIFSEYYATSQTALIPKIATFKDNTMTIRGQYEAWSDAIDEITSFSSSINNMINSLESQIEVFNTEIYAIRANAGVNTSFSNEGIASSADTAMVVYPVGTKPLNSNYNSNALLGTNTYRWNLYAGAVDAYNIGVENIFVKKHIYLEGDKIATQAWTMDWIDWLASQIKNQSGGSSTAAGGSFSGINRIIQNLINLLNTLTLWGGTTGASGAENENYAPGGAYNELHIKVPTVTFHVNGNASTGGESFDATKQADFSKTLLVISGGNIPINTGYSGTVATWQGSTKIGAAVKDVAAGVDTKAVGSFGKGTCSDAGEVSIKYSSVNNTELGTITFDMAGTAFFKAHALKKFIMGSASATASTYFSSATVNLTSMKESDITWAEDGKSGTCNYECQSIDGTALLKGTSKIPTKGAYDKGYTDGWNAACAALTVDLTHPNNSTDGDVTAIAEIAADTYLKLAGKKKTETSKIDFEAGTTGTAGSDSSISKNTTAKGAKYGPLYEEGAKDATAYYIHYSAGSAGSAGTLGSLTWGTHSNT